MELRQQFFDDVPMHVGQAAVDAVVAEGELGVVDAEQVQDRGVDVVDLGGCVAVGRLVAQLVAFARNDAALDAAAAEPVREDIRVVVAALAALRAAASGRTRSSTGRSCRRAGRAASDPESAPPRRAPCRAPAGRDRASTSSCESQLRRGKPLSLPLQICTKRTPRSSSRRATRHLRPK